LYKGKTFLAVIPARGGSKGIPGKNIIKVQGKPLIQYTIDAAMKSKYLDCIFVSTDDEIIAEVALRGGAEVPFLRPSNLALDASKTIDVLVHVIDELKKQGERYDFLVLLQPTQPLRQSFHIDEAIEQICDNGFKDIIGVSKVREHPILMRNIDGEGYLENLLDVTSTVRRQDFPEVFKVNGAIYINKIDELFNENLSLNDNKIPYIMDSKYDLDIDTYSDIRIFEALIYED